jgi:hypothetical protein
MELSKQAQEQFNEHLPRLGDLYQRGLLVPFVGSGMSVPACTLWAEFVSKLEQLIHLKSAGGTTAPELVQRSARAVRRLRQMRSTQFFDIVKTALEGDKPEVAPLATLALAQIRRPYKRDSRLRFHHAFSAPVQQIRREAPPPSAISDPQSSCLPSELRLCFPSKTMQASIAR